MNIKARFLAASIVLLGALPAQANTTYTYEGGLFTENYAPSIWGTRITGEVTFSFDTSHYTGTIYYTPGSIADLSLSSGVYTADALYASSQFGLQDGAITYWNLSGSVLCGILTSGCRIATASNGAFFPDFAQQECLSCGSAFIGRASGPNGSWTMVSPAQIPAPALGDGLPGLITACLGMFELVRRRRKLS